MEKEITISPSSDLKLISNIILEDRDYFLIKAIRDLTEQLRRLNNKL